MSVDWQRTLRNLEAADARAGAPATEEVRIRGRVVGVPDRRSFTVHVVANAPEPLLILEREVASGDRFDLAFPSAELRGTDSVTVGALVPGFVRSSRALGIKGAGAHDVELQVASGLTLAGVVVDAFGGPVRELPLRAIAGPVPPSVLSGANLDTRSRRLATADSAYHENSDVTDSTGAFEIRGLGPGEYSIVAESSEWFIEQAQRYPAGSSELRLRATKALSAELRVLDVETRSPVPRARVELEVRPVSPEVPSYIVAVSGRDGLVRATWRPHGDEVDRGFGIAASVEIPCYAPHGRAFAVGPGEARFTCEVTLQRLPEGRLVVGVSDCTARPFEGPVALDCVSSTVRDLGRSAVSLGTLAPGEYTCALPAGRWFVRVFPVGPAGRLVSFVQEVDVPAGGEVRTRGALQPFGSVRIRVHPELARRMPLHGSMRSSDVPGYAMAVSEFSVDEPNDIVEFVPEGRWPLRVRRDADDYAQAAVDVRAGRTEG